MLSLQLALPARLVKLRSSHSLGGVAWNNHLVAMHEMSLCLSMLEILSSSAQQHDFTKVRAVCLELGKHGCADPETLRFAFEVASQNTLAEGARLDIVIIPVQAWCLHCEQLVNLDEDYGACPDCGGDQLRLETGQELKIKNVEVE